MVRVYLKDLTADDYLERVIPTDDLKLNPNHEYIICDCDVDCGEYFSIEELNKFFQETEVDLETIKILGTTFLWNEVVEMIQSDSPIIINFDDETGNWNCGSGVPADDHWIGYLMYDLGFNTLPCKVPDALVDYINWENNWSGLQSVGWRVTQYNGNHYIVHR